MTHYTIDYSKMEEGPAKQRAACKDALEYLGAPVYRKIVKLIKMDEEALVNLACMMQGIQGYPTWAMWKRYNPEAL